MLSAYLNYQAQHEKECQFNQNPNTSWIL